jgi:hypothetical protein
MTYTNDEAGSIKKNYVRNMFYYWGGAAKMEQKYEEILGYNEDSFLSFSFYKRVKKSENRQE